ncbi:rho GTPase-activating protein 20 [Trichonephila inaurata madagascariensis]|uniref:Rho GTPase-activating protein 20 n=1 Tax=Trichonephila inaurata madagascariensis TaxID=2747483 RepID=A0A8X6YUK3_9ARAC|nr:rho GTPase-activating protein 20 [Trichonephila inaurata madagascariensis]
MWGLSSYRRVPMRKQMSIELSLENNLIIDRKWFVREASDARALTMSGWAQRMHRGAATLSNVVTSCGHTSVPYPTRMEKVKFGVPLDQVCKHDIPGPLLILILKLNKEGPIKKDVFRAPGHQGNMKKLIHFLQHGRLVNIDNFSVYTIASVLKKFLRKLPGGIFGHGNEEVLFDIINIDKLEEKRDRIHRLITSLPVVAQHLLVLLFGTFHAIAHCAQKAQTGMTSEAIGVSVAPSFFQSCVSDGKMARMEDVVRFKVATRIMKFLIDNFGATNLFGKENYEYYARMTGRIFKVAENWIFAFHYPPDSLVSRNYDSISSQEECRSTPALIHASESMVQGDGPQLSGSLSNLADTYTRLSVSLEENGLYKAASPISFLGLDPDELKAVNRYAESTKSLSFLPQVHERQTARMRTRSEWFLNPSPCPSPTPIQVPPEIDENEEVAIKLMRTNDSKRGSNASSVSSSSLLNTVGSGSDNQLVRRPSGKGSRLVRRSSSKSKRDKENGAGASCVSTSGLAASSKNKRDSGVSKVVSLGSSVSTEPLPVSGSSPARTKMLNRLSNPVGITEQDCTELDVQSFHVTLTYKPRI